MQKPHPPLWIGAQSPTSIRFAAENGFNLLLGQGGGPETVAEGISIYRRAIEAQGRVFDPATVGCTRALHIAMNDDEREKAPRAARQVHGQRAATVAVADRRIADPGPPAQDAVARRDGRADRARRADRPARGDHPAPQAAAGRRPRIRDGHGFRRQARPSAHLRPRGHARFCRDAERAEPLCSKPGRVRCPSRGSRASFRAGSWAERRGRFPAACSSSAGSASASGTFRFVAAADFPSTGCSCRTR